MAFAAAVLQEICGRSPEAADVARSLRAGPRRLRDREAEFIIAGLLPIIASDLSVSIPAAGLLVSGYAIGVAIGGPILALATARVPRRPMILWMVGLYAVGHVLCAIAPNYVVLLGAPVVVALTAAA